MEKCFLFINIYIDFSLIGHPVPKWCSARGIPTESALIQFYETRVTLNYDWGVSERGSSSLRVRFRIRMVYRVIVGCEVKLQLHARTLVDCIFTFRSLIICCGRNIADIREIRREVGQQ